MFFRILFNNLADMTTELWGESGYNVQCRTTEVLLGDRSTATHDGLTLYSRRYHRYVRYDGNLTNHSPPSQFVIVITYDRRFCRMPRDANITNCIWNGLRKHWEEPTYLPQLVSSLRSSQVTFPSHTKDVGRHSPLRQANSASEQLLFTRNKKTAK